MSPFGGLSAKNMYFKHTYALGVVKCTPVPWAGFVVTGSALDSLQGLEAPGRYDCEM